MRGKAFCPAHVTGFFKAGGGGSVGAGFSMGLGVTTEAEALCGSGTSIEARGRECADLSVSECVAGRFRDISGFGGRLEIRHELGVPPGYGLGCSAAAALSLAYALDEALGTGLGAQRAASVAHEAELECRTGLGDVAAAWRGGFEIRTAPGGPGKGMLSSVQLPGTAAVVACIAPVPTKDFMRDRMGGINGLGGKMVAELSRGGGLARFHRMSFEFAEHAGLATARVRRAARALRGAGLGCGVAMIGETVFSLVPAVRAGEAARVLRSSLDAEVLVSCIGGGAHLEAP